jgi:uncharacterized protein YceK
MKKITAVAIAAMLLTGCATVRFADGERVAIEHDMVDAQRLQAQADQVCRESGGRAPATLVSDMPVNPALPPAISRMVATFRCG